MTPVFNTATGSPAIPDPLLLPPNNLYRGGGPAGVAGFAVGGVVGLPSTVAPNLGGTPWFDQYQFFPFHNHDDYKATNNGVYPGGQFTMVRLDP